MRRPALALLLVLLAAGGALGALAVLAGGGHEPPAATPDEARAIDAAAARVVAGEVQARAPESQREVVPVSALGTEATPSAGATETLRVRAVRPDGTPLPGARVELWDAGSGGPFGDGPAAPLRARTAGRDGACAFDVAPGDYTLRAEALTHGASRRVRVDWPAVRAHGFMDIVVPAWCWVRGRVLGRDGLPAAAASVLATNRSFGGTQVLAPEPRPVFRFPGPLEPERTASHACLADGSFALQLPARGRYRLRGRFGDEMTEAVEVTTVEGGQLDVTLRALGTHVITGLVVDENGAPIARARVQVRNDAGERVTECVAGDDGAFEAALAAPGAYSVVARTGDRIASPPQPVSLAEPGKSAHVVVALVLGAEISGTLVDEDGAPLGGVPVLVREEGSHAEQRQAAHTAADGAFRVAGLDRSRRYDLAFRFAALRHVRARGVAAGTRDLVARVTEADRKGTRVRVALAAETGPVPAQPSVVVSRELAPGLWASHELRSTDVQRTADVLLLPGLDADVRHLVTVRSDGFAPARSAPFRGDAELALTLVRPVPATIRVVDRDGNPSAGHSLILRPTGKGTVIGTAESDARGIVRITYLAPGRYRVALSDGRVLEPAWDVSPGAEARLDVRVP